MLPGMGVVRGAPNNRKLEQFDRQMGCMTGFLQVFDRHQILSGKRFYSIKRLPSSMAAGSTSSSEKSEISTSSLLKEVPEFPFSPSPDVSPSSQENLHPTNFSERHTLPLPVLERKDGPKPSWKLREAPRLSLDSRANVDAKGNLCSREIHTAPGLFTENMSESIAVREKQVKQRRCPSVVARLMGLEEFPVEEQPKMSELRRSVSESRVTRDRSQLNFQKPFPQASSEEDFGHLKKDSAMRYRGTIPAASPLTLGSIQRKCNSDDQEFIPETKRAGSLYGEIEKRLRMRGIEEPARDLETLKQILEALQLKGLLHTKQPEDHDRSTQSSATVRAPIVVMKPVPKLVPRLAGSEPSTLSSKSKTSRRLPMPESIPLARMRRNRLEIDRNIASVGRKSPRLPDPCLVSKNHSEPPTKRRPINGNVRRAPQPHRRIPAVGHSKFSPKRVGSIQLSSPQYRRPATNIPPMEILSTAEDDTSIAHSDISIVSSVSQSEFERARKEDYSSGRSLLERCDKLLHSIAAITSSAEQATPTDRQLSPVSVLDSSFLSDKALGTSLLSKRTIEFNESDQLTEWKWGRSNQQPTSIATSDSSRGSRELESTFDKHQNEDYGIVADVLRRSDLHGSVDEAFASFNIRHRTADSSNLHRRLLFDAATELVNRKRLLSPWDNFSGVIPDGNAILFLEEVWEELCQIQDRIPAEDVLEATCGLMKKDMAAGSDRQQGWGEPGVEISEAVLHMKRLVFKDLVDDTIRELVDLSGSSQRNVFGRKLVF